MTCLKTFAGAVSRDALKNLVDPLKKIQEEFNRDVQAEMDGDIGRPGIRFQRRTQGDS